MAYEFEILESTKVGLNSKESYIVVRNETSFLRILGNDPKWRLMTATASEDRGCIHVCAEQRRLIECALRFGVELKTGPYVEIDWCGREYVNVCEITQDSGQNDEAFNDENSRHLTRFFEIYDNYLNQDSRAEDEMRELYDALSIDGQDVYLSDGVWLSSDGTSHDRGR